MKKIYLKGFTLIEILLSLAIGAILLIGLAKLHFIVQQTYNKISSTSDVYTSGLQALDYLNSNAAKAGAGFITPTITQTPIRQAGAPASFVMQGWSYLGYFYDNPHVFSTAQTFASNVFNSCKDLLLNSYPNSEYIALQNSNTCYISPTGFDANILYNNYGIDSSGSNVIACAGDTSHRCGGTGNAAQVRNDIYQRLIPHVQVASNGAQGDLLAINFAVRNGNATNCLGNTVNAVNSATTTVPILINNNFRVSTNNTLQCQTRTRGDAGNWGAMSAWVDIIPNIEHMRVMVGVNDNLENATAINRYVVPTAPSSASLDQNRIVSIRLALIARSPNRFKPTANSQNFNLFYGPTNTNIVYTSAFDNLKRNLFTSTIYLKEFIPPYYPAHCVQASPGSGRFYIKIGGTPWVNSATSSDYCCGPQGSNCYYFNTLSECELNRNIDEFSTQIRVNPQ